jgi:hypothetical protein
MATKAIPYPLRAMKISLDIAPFAFWFVPTFRHRRALTETAREAGQCIWYARWLWFQISYSRWV